LLDQLVVVDRLAEAHVDDDLLQLRDLHRVLVAEVLHQLRHHRLLVGLGEARGVLALGVRLSRRGLDGGRGLLLLAALLRLLLARRRRRDRAFALGVLLFGLLFFALLVFGHFVSPYWSICAPLRLAMRTRLPLSRSFVPILVGFFDSRSMR